MSLKWTLTILAPGAGAATANIAERKGDTRTYYFCRLPEHREYLTFEAYLACNTAAPDSKLFALQKQFGLDRQAVAAEISRLYKAKHGGQARPPQPHNQELVHKALNNLVTDRIGFLAAVEAATKRPGQPDVMGNLRNLRITGDKAVGESTGRLYSDPADPSAKGQLKWQEYPTTVEFQKTKEGWFISKG